MERKGLRKVISITNVIVSPIVFCCLVYYIVVFFQSKNIIIDATNVKNYLTFIACTFTLTITSLMLGYYNFLSNKRLEALSKEILSLQSLNIELQMQFKQEIITELGGDKLE